MATNLVIWDAAAWADTRSIERIFLVLKKKFKCGYRRARAVCLYSNSPVCMYKFARKI